MTQWHEVYTYSLVPKVLVTNPAKALKIVNPLTEDTAYLRTSLIPSLTAVVRNNIKYQDEKDLIANDEIYKLIKKDMIKFQKQLANYERVRKFVLLDKPFTIESGEITPSLKVKRKVLEQRYEKLIDSMYAAHKV